MIYCGCFVFLFIGLFYFGLLVVVVGSWLCVCYVGGCWLVWMEDIDLLCEVVGVVVDIFVILFVFGLVVDELVLFQLQWWVVYDVVFEQFWVDGYLFVCGCSCSDLVVMGGLYCDGVCVLLVDL